jgi:hypothetical protein
MENTISFDNQPALDADYNPLQENVKQRPYTRPNVEVTDATPIAEPVFTPPSFEELQSGFEAEMATEKGAQSSSVRHEICAREPSESREGGRSCALSSKLP